MLPGLLLIVGFLRITHWEPSFFNQDDNFAQFSPLIVAGVRSFLYHGVFPAWNPHNVLGMPLADLGIYALTYPPTYLAVWIADAWIGNPSLWVNIFFLLHAIPAVYLLYHWFVRVSRSPLLALSCALSYPLSGYFAIAGRSWYYMLPTMLWLPVLLSLVFALPGKPKGKWILQFGVASGLLFHAGNAQMWIYAQIFVGLTGLFLIAGKRGERLGVTANLGFGLFLGLILALPLLLVQFDATKNLERAVWGHGLAQSLRGMLLPYPWGAVTHPNVGGPFRTDLGGFIGFFNPLIVIVGLVFLGTRFWSSRRLGTGYFLGWLAVIAFVLTLGDQGLLWKWMGHLPLFNKFTHPIKYIPFFSLFALCFVCYQWRNNRWAERWAAPLGVAGIFLVLYQSWFYGTAFYSYGETQYAKAPSEAIQSAMQALRTPEQPLFRVYNFSPARSTVKGYGATLPHNINALYDIPSVFGYDILTLFAPETKAIVDHMLKIGVFPWAREYGVKLQLYFDEATGATQMQSSPNAKPLVFEKSSARPVPFEFDFAGIHVRNDAAAAGEVVMAWAMRPGMKAYLDGKRLPVEADEFGRMVVTVPDGWQELDVLYRPRWTLGLRLSVGLLILSAVSFRILQWWMNRRRQDFPLDSTGVIRGNP